MKQFFIFLLILVCAKSLFGQESTSDKLKSLEYSGTTTSEKAILLNEISWAYYEGFNDSSFIYANKSLVFSKQHKQRKQNIVAHLQIAEYFRSERDNISGESHLESAAQLLKKHSFPDLDVYLILFKGNLAYSNGDDSLATDLYNSGLLESAKHNKELEAEFYLNFAKLNIRSSAFDLAEKNFLNAALSANKQSDSKREILAYNRLGNLFARQQLYSEALTNFEKSLQVATLHSNVKGQGTAFLNIGNIYYFKGYWTTAIEYYTKSAVIKQRLKDLAGTARIHNNIGAIYKEQHRYDKSVEYYEKVQRIMQQSTITFCWQKRGSIFPWPKYF